MNGVFAVECRWLARAIGGAILFFVGAHLLTGGLPNLADAPPGERAMFFWFATAMIGFAVLWKWDLAGAAISIAGGLGFYLTELALSGRFPSGWVLPMFFAPGMLVLLGRWLETRRPAV